MLLEVAGSPLDVDGIPSHSATVPGLFFTYLLALNESVMD